MIIQPPRCGASPELPRPLGSYRQSSPPVFPLGLESEDFSRPPEDREPSKNGFPEERNPQNTNSPKDNHFFNPIRTGNRRPYPIERRKETFGNPFGTAGYEISPFRSSFKDSPIVNGTESESINSESKDAENSEDTESLIDQIQNITDTDFSFTTKREGRATKQMESDFTVGLTVMPIENGEI